jgi:hypothetical protein
MTNGTVYERLPGNTQTVRDPALLADLFLAATKPERRLRPVLIARRGPSWRHLEALLVSFVGSGPQPRPTSRRTMRHILDTPLVWLRPAIRLTSRAARGFGDVYVTVLVAGGRFVERTQPGRSIEIQRGPLLPGVDDGHVASIGRELERAVGGATPEP